MSAVLAALAHALAPASAAAAASAWWRSEHASVRLIAASDAVGDGRPIAVGLQFALLPGWKVYWRTPGDAGFPPQPDWSGSENLALAEVAWPAPERFSVLGLETLGYKGELVLPVEVAAFEPGRPLEIRATVPFLTCDEICVPYKAEIGLELPAGPETVSREAALIETWRARVPMAAGEGAPLAVQHATVSGPVQAQAIELEIAARDGTPLGRPDAYVEGPPRHSFSAPIVSLASDRRTALLRLAVGAPSRGAQPLAGQRVTVTVVDGDRAVEQTLALAAAPQRPPDAAGGRTLLAILALALLGGLILNLMPCVLPVLSIKLLSIVGHGGAPASVVRRGFLASSAGIVASFLVLGSVAAALHAAGAAAGWGVQFQQPVFLAAMVAVLVLFAANLWGLFEIALPGAVADRALAWGGKGGLVGHFLTGALATLLATPCSAPFLGTAVGFALTRGTGEIYAVFAALGIGLASPYLAVAAVPRLVSWLPRPGAWMIWLTKALALALIATALWLLFVIAAQIGWTMAGMVAALMAAALVALVPMRDLPGRARATSWAVVALLSLLAVLAAAAAGRQETPRLEASGAWRAFDLAAIPGLVADGKTVLVDVTADWCLTCKVNKAVALDDTDVVARISAGEVVAMRADWTRPDARIAAYLKSFGRFGIPFNAVYGPGVPGGRALPELLTPSIVLDALAEAGQGAEPAAPALVGR